MKFSKMIHVARVEQGWTLAALATRMSIDAAIISKVERGLRRATRGQVGQFIDVLGLSEKDAFTAWLSDKILAELEGEPFAMEAFVVAEKEVKYLRKQQQDEASQLQTGFDGLVTQLDELASQWKAKKPLAGIQLEKLQEYFNVAYTYDSNKIEGNTLTLQETHLVVNEGLTIGGKSMREHLEAVNHHEAIDYLHELAQKNVKISERVIKELHYLVLKGIDRENAGRYRTVPVIISGSAHKPPQPYLLARKMEELMEFYDAKKQVLHPVILAAEMHLRLVTIHPFIDGNGRTSRLLMNLILLQNGFTIANLKGTDQARLAYYQALENAQADEEHRDFYRLILEVCVESLESHLEMVG
ncbi:MAG TPA: DNA-binding protein [Saprospiraceae bacterium]|nr:DNA-binding protein [Saprospiraceae bacterium]